jgi:mRNA interferase RelE/StbE
MPHRIEITATALEALQRITDGRTRAAIGRRIDGLADEPRSQGKALRGKLAGLWSVRAAGQRYRIIYRMTGKNEVVVVLLVGIRRNGSRQDIYVLAQRLIERGLI